MNAKTHHFVNLSDQKGKKRAATFKYQAIQFLREIFSQTFLSPLPASTLITIILFLTEQKI